MWVRLWEFCFVALFCVFFFFVLLYYSVKSGSLLPLALTNHLMVVCAMQGLLSFQIILEFFGSSSLKNAIYILIGMSLNL